MEYKKGVRTKNLTLRDIHVGDWVQVWSELFEHYSSPMKVIQICDDGTIYLVTSDRQRPLSWKQNIKDVDALPITPELLKGFGFKFEDQNVTPKEFVECFLYNDIRIGYFYTYPNGKTKCMVICRDCVYMHDLCGRLASFFPSIKLEWKEIEK